MGARATAGEEKRAAPAETEVGGAVGRADAGAGAGTWEGTEAGAGAGAGEGPSMRDIFSARETFPIELAVDVAVDVAVGEGAGKKARAEAAGAAAATAAGTAGDPRGGARPTKTEPTDTEPRARSCEPATCSNTGLASAAPLEAATAGGDAPGEAWPKPMARCCGFSGVRCVAVDVVAVDDAMARAAAGAGVGTGSGEAAGEAAGEGAGTGAGPCRCVGSSCSRGRLADASQREPAGAGAALAVGGRAYTEAAREGERASEGESDFASAPKARATELGVARSPFVDAVGSAELSSLLSLLSLSLSSPPLLPGSRTFLTRETTLARPEAAPAAAPSRASAGSEEAERPGLGAGDAERPGLGAGEAERPGLGAGEAEGPGLGAGDAERPGLGAGAGAGSAAAESKTSSSLSGPHSARAPAEPLPAPSSALTTLVGTKVSPLLRADTAAPPAPVPAGPGTAAAAVAGTSAAQG